MAAVPVDHLRGEIVMGGCDWIREGGGFDDGAVLEIEVAELGFEGGDSAVYVGFCGFEGLELVEDPRGFVMAVGFHFRVRVFGGKLEWKCAWVLREEES